MSTESNVDRSEINKIRSRLSSQEADFSDKIEDVRDKIIMLKKQIDSKADESHGHDEYVTQDTQDARISEVREDLGSQIDDLEEKVASIDDVEEEQNEKLNILARHILSIEDDISEIRSLNQKRLEEKRKMDALVEKMHKAGSFEGICQSCGEKINVEMIRKPECPYCEAELIGVETRFILSDVIRTDEESSPVGYDSFESNDDSNPSESAGS